MGKPLVPSFDSLVFYKHVVEPTAPYFKNIHPIFITLFNVLIKYWAIMCLLRTELSMVEMLSIHTLERYLDCLDGHLARRYNKCTTVGHYMDKSTDFVFRWTCAGVMCTQAYHRFFNHPFCAIFIFGMSLLCCGVYILDTLVNGTVVNGVATAESYAIYIEDNGTLLCVLVPVCMYIIQS